MVLDHLKSAGVRQIDRGDRITFTSVLPWPGEYIGAEVRFMEGEAERRAAIFIGPEFGTVSRVQLTAAAREASESRFDILIAVSVAFDAHAMELSRLDPLPVLKAKKNPDLHMADDLNNSGKGNLFTIFGEPDIDIIDQPDGRIVVKVNGVDIYARFVLAEWRQVVDAWNLRDPVSYANVPRIGRRRRLGRSSAKPCGRFSRPFRTC